MKRRREQGADKPNREEKPAKRNEKEADAPDGSTPVQPRRYPDPVDDTLDNSFPASDPPSWAGRQSGSDRAEERQKPSVHPTASVLSQSRLRLNARLLITL